MRKKGLNPRALAVSIAWGIFSLAVALVCKAKYFAGIRWKDLLFWVLFLALAGIGVFLAGRFLNKGGR